MSKHVNSSILHSIIDKYEWSKQDQNNKTVLSKFLVIQRFLQNVNKQLTSNKFVYTQTHSTYQYDHFDTYH